MIFIGKSALKEWIFVRKNVPLQHKIVLEYAEKENRNLLFLPAYMLP